MADQRPAEPPGLPQAIQLPWGPANWQPWTPQMLAAKLVGLDCRWAVVGGWALDLFTGVVRRDHSDLEIIVPRRSFHLIEERLSGEVAFYVTGAEGQWPLATAGAARDRYQQTFARDEATGTFVLDVMRVADSGVWELAGHPEITRAWDESIETTASGIPYLSPEQVLLYEALGIGDDDPRVKDGADFLAVLPFLGHTARDWLARTLSALRSNHSWLRTLSLVDAG